MKKHNLIQNPAPSPASEIATAPAPEPPDLEVLEPPQDPDNPDLYPSRRKRDTPHNLSDAIKRQIVEFACERIAEGEFLSEVCGYGNMPCTNTFRSWLRENVELTVLYEGAKEDREDYYANLARVQAAELVRTYKDSAGNTRVDPADVADKRLRVNSTHRILNMLTVKSRHKDFNPAAAIDEAKKAGHANAAHDPTAGERAMGRLQQWAIDGYRQYHLDKFGEYLTDEQGLEAIKKILPYYSGCDMRHHCSSTPIPKDPIRKERPYTPPPAN